MRPHKRKAFWIILYIVLLIAVGVIIEKSLGDKAKFSVINEAVAPGPVSGDVMTGTIINTGDNN